MKLKAAWLLPVIRVRIRLIVHNDNPSNRFLSRSIGVGGDGGKGYIKDDTPLLIRHALPEKVYFFK